MVVAGESTRDLSAKEAKLKWWSISVQVELDWYASLEHRFDHVASISHSTCAEPANVRDEMLVGHGPVVSEPVSNHTVRQSSSLLLVSLTTDSAIRT